MTAQTFKKEFYDRVQALKTTTLYIDKKWSDSQGSNSSTGLKKCEPKKWGRWVMFGWWPDIVDAGVMFQGDLRWVFKTGSIRSRNNIRFQSFPLNCLVVQRTLDLCRLMKMCH